MRLTLRVWRQAGPEESGAYVEYHVPDAEPEMSLLELLDSLNDRLVDDGVDPVAFDSDCREGICGACGVTVDGRAHGPAENTPSCHQRLDAYSDGDTLRIEILRNDRRQTLNVRSGTRPSAAELRAGSGVTEPESPPAAAVPTGQVVAGLNLAPLSPALRDRYDIPAEVDGVVVTGVAAGGDRRFQPGFVILRAGTSQATSVADVQTAVTASRQAGRDNVFLLVRTPQGNNPVAMPLPKAD